MDVDELVEIRPRLSPPGRGRHLALDPHAHAAAHHWGERPQQIASTSATKSTKFTRKPTGPWVNGDASHRPAWSSAYSYPTTRAAYHYNSGSVGGWPPTNRYSNESESTSAICVA